MNYSQRFAYAILFISVFAALFPASAFAIDSKDKLEIEQIIREYLLENPEIIDEMQEIAKAKQDAELATKQQETLISKAVREKTASEDRFASGREPC